MRFVLFVLLGTFSLPLMADGTPQASEPPISVTSPCDGKSCPICPAIQMPKIP